MERVYDEACELKDSVNESNVYSVNQLGNLLSFAGKMYFAQLDVMDAMAANMLNVSSTRILSEAITGYEVSTKSTFGVISSLSEGGLYIDVDTDVHSAIYLGSEDTLSGNTVEQMEEMSKDVSRQYMLSAGFFSSYFESAIWEEITGEESISTISILAGAAEDGVDILAIGKNNLDASIDALRTNDTGKLSDSIVNEIKNAVNEGKLVIIPEKEASIGNWSGYGYILLDNNSGAGAYMISGGLNGGMSPEVLGIVAMVDLTIAVVDLVETVMMVESLLTSIFIMFSANPVALAIGAVIGVGLIAFMTWALANTYSLIEAALSGDVDSVYEILNDTLCNILYFFGAKVLGKVLEKFAATIATKVANKAFNAAVEKCGAEAVERLVKNFGDDAIKYIKKYGDDFVKICDECGEQGFKFVKDYVFGWFYLKNMYYYLKIDFIYHY